jgi:hypothetical protein
MAATQASLISGAQVRGNLHCNSASPDWGTRSIEAIAGADDHGRFCVSVDWRPFMSDVERPLPAGVLMIAGLFAVGVLASGASALALFPGGLMESIWRLNPQAHAALESLGRLGVFLMSAVCVTCATASNGLLRQALWGYCAGCEILTFIRMTD